MACAHSYICKTFISNVCLAGITLDQATGSQTSVHVGCFTHDFEKMVQADLDLPGKNKILGSSKSILANRLSWFYDLRGPSVVVDTACSSSLVALHQACQALHTGDAGMVSLFT
jgi:acyl transferase domain-containing protein